MSDRLTAHQSPPIKNPSTRARHYAIGGIIPNSAGRTWDWSSPKQPLPNAKSSSAGQRSPASRTGREGEAGWPPSVLLSSQTHDRQAAAPCKTASTAVLKPRSKPEWLLPS
jgi:hypothetical protein